MILRAADFSNIEGRVLAWLAGEHWKLDAFRAYDAFLLDDFGQKIPDPEKPDEFLREGPDLYKVTAGNIVNKPPEAITKDERQDIGKVSELALGYQGGVGAMTTMSRGKVDFAALYVRLSQTLPDHAERAAEAYEQRGKGQGLSREGWQGAEIIKLAWRATNAKIAALWPALEDAAIAAVFDPGSIHTCGKLSFRVAGSFLFMLLPSGRTLAYAYPRLKDDVTPWGKPIKKIRFAGVDSVTGKWGPQETYGGKLVENATQAVARDVLAEAMVRLADAGWPIVLHVHDEAVCETEEHFGSTEEMERIMSVLPDWAEGLPVSAEGWSGERYRK